MRREVATTAAITTERGPEEEGRLVDRLSRRGDKLVRANYKATNSSHMMISL